MNIEVDYMAEKLQFYFEKKNIDDDLFYQICEVLSKDNELEEKIYELITDKAEQVLSMYR